MLNRILDVGDSMQHIRPDQLLRLLQDSLTAQQVDYERVIERFGQVRTSDDRARGKEFAFRDHVRGLVLSLLSNQRPWRRIEENLERIECIFFGYDPVKIKKADPSQIEKSLRKIQCGNRSIHKQMAELGENIDTFEKMAGDYGSLDKFVTSAPADQIARKLSRGRYKLKQIGFTLALEYLRNVGIRAPKSDTHVKRFISGARLRFVKGDPDPYQAYSIMVRLADEAGVNRTYLDNLLWLFCARDYGNICGAAPRCGACLLRCYCAYP
jgi:endonuclease III